MLVSNASTVELRVQELIKNFDKYIEIYTKRGPFGQPGQLDYHRRTIALRRNAGSATNAINDDDFLWSLYETLRFWGMDSQGAHRAPFPKFKDELRLKATLISAFDEIRIDDQKLDIQEKSSELWQIMNSLEINLNDTKLVACSKILHHILPDLVVPIDRRYTGRFFEKTSESAFDNTQENTFIIAMGYFAKIAISTNPIRRVGKGWNTCQTKIIDNAIVGYIRALEYNISV
ncbi:MAG: hypothetical protein WCE68_08355 [Anaerolineales bacterium]